MKKNIKIIIPVLMLAGLILHLPVVSFPQQEHQKIVEEVKVTWWQVPVFAVDKAGNPVTDLKPEDIQVQLNGRQMPAFTLQKRAFSVTQRKTEKIPGEIPGAKQLPMMKNKVVFLLFDLALSGETSTRLAKKIAQKIITEAETDTRFIVMTIDAFAGLVYIGEGGSKNKDELVRTIKDKVKLKTNKRIVDIGEILGGLGGVAGGKKAKSKYEGNELLLFEEAIAKWYKRKNMGFFYAFETLYFLLNSIEDNKFIYFFSEGMSRSILTSNRSLAGARGMYNYYLKRVANYLSRCGAVLFIINSMGVLQYSTAMGNVADSTSPLSGEDSLHFLAKESGGTYLEGAQEKIVERLENIHRAYYEISFPDVPQLKGATREINIIPKRKGIKIHSLNTLEKRKQYNQMNPVEKEMLALNLITQPQNSLIKGKISAYNARVNKTKKSKKSVIYHVTLPTGYLRQYIDLYKVWLTVNDQGTAQLEKIEKESLYPQKDRIKIQFQLTADTGDNKQKQEQKETGGETRTYFVLVNKSPHPVRASVHGMELYEEDPQLIEEEKKKIAKKRTKGETISAEEMHRILQGAAQYCEKLKQSAFHFYCREKILETRIPLTDAERKDPYISKRDMKQGVVRVLDEIRNKAFTHVKSYIFGYRLIKQGNKINEERDWISSTDNIKVNRDQVIQTNAFFSQKAIFAPITLLDRTRQHLYEFQFVKFAQPNGRQAAVIEAAPKNPVETATIYGKIWIDTQDFSVIKIQAAPESIRGYQQLKDLAKKLRTRLYLSLVSEFDETRQGIRFPTKVSMIEKYKGGRIISGYRGSKGWERTLTEFTYTDYQFFNVQTDVTVH